MCVCVCVCVCQSVRPSRFAVFCLYFDVRYRNRRKKATKGVKFDLEFIFDLEKIRTHLKNLIFENHSANFLKLL